MSQDFSGQNLRGKSFRGLDMSGADFSYCKLQGANFSKAILQEANFSNSSMGLSTKVISLLIILCLVLSLLLGLCGFVAGIFLPVTFTAEFIKINTILPGLGICLVVSILSLLTFFTNFKLGLIGSAITLFGITMVAEIMGSIQKISQTIILLVPRLGALALCLAIISILIIALLVTIAGLVNPFLGVFCALIMGSLATISIGFSTGLTIAALITRASMNTTLSLLATNVILMLLLTGVATYMAWRGLSGDRRYLWIVNSALFLIGRGTNFQQADLTNADFTAASLKCANFEKANLTGTRFDGAKNFIFAKFR